MSEFEEQMIYHAAPALLGEKQANLFSFPLSRLSDYRQEIEGYRRQLAPLGISVEYLYCCQKRVFLLIYRKELLLQYLNQPAVNSFLLREGYPKTTGNGAFLSETILFLRQRISSRKEFPHEIGFFLGYPVEDVFSFIRERGENYKLCGYWKVYGDEKSALHTFLSYKECRNRLMQQAASGIPIPTLLCTEAAI